MPQTWNFRALLYIPRSQVTAGAVMRSRTRIYVIITSSKVKNSAVQSIMGIEESFAFLCCRGTSIVKDFCLYAQQPFMTLGSGSSPDPSVFIETVSLGEKYDYFLL